VTARGAGQSKREGWEWENFWLANQAFSVLITLIYILPLLGPDTINQAHALAGEAAVRLPRAPPPPPPLVLSGHAASLTPY